MVKIVDRKIDTLDDVEFPELVYKYRTWSNDIHKTIITDRSVFLAAPSNIEDSLDCKFPVRWDLLTDEQIFNKYYNESKQMNAGQPEVFHISFAEYWSINTRIKDQAFIEERRIIDFATYDERIGVLSLTANPLIEKMWKDYADEHHGICVGFNSSILFEFLGGGGEVNYVDEIPIIYPMPFHSYDQQRGLQIFSKLDKWAYEEEYRTTIFNTNGLNNDSRKIILPPEAYNEVILGKNMTEDQKREIKRVLSIDLSHVQIIEAK